MNNSALGLAFLQSCFQSGGNPALALSPIVQRSFVKNRLNKEILSIPDIQTLTSQTFGLEIPVHVIRYIMATLKKRDIVSEIFDNQNRKAEPKYKAKNIERTVILELEKSSESKYKNLISDIKRTFLDSEIKRDPENFLFDWLENSALSIFGSETKATLSTSNDNEINRLMALCLQEHSQSNFLETLTEIAIGDTIFRGIKASTEFDIHLNEDLKDLVVYLDTPILLSALGIHDPYFEAASQELINMCSATGAQIAAFDHTLKELQNIIANAAGSLYYPDQGSATSIKRWAIRNGLDASALYEFAATIEGKLNEFNINIIPRSFVAEDYSLAVDDTSLLTYLENRMPSQSQSARDHDKDALTAIYRLRNGKPFRTLAKCKAIFITSNKGIQSVAAKFFKNIFRNQGISGRDSSLQLCMTDVVFSMRLWTRLPTNLKTLPKSQIISHTLANIAPSSQIRDKFSMYLDKLVSSGRITNHEKAAIELSNFAELTIATSFEVTESNLSDAEAENIYNEIVNSNQRLFGITKLKQVETKEKVITEMEGEIAQLTKRLKNSEQFENEKKELQRKLDILTQDFEQQKEQIATESSDQKFARQVAIKMSYVIFFMILVLLIAVGIFSDGILHYSLQILLIALTLAGWSIKPIRKSIQQLFERLIIFLGKQH